MLARTRHRITQRTYWPCCPLPPHGVSVFPKQIPIASSPVFYFLRIVVRAYRQSSLGDNPQTVVPGGAKFPDHRIWERGEGFPHRRHVIFSHRREGVAQKLMAMQIPAVEHTVTGDQ